MAKNIVIIVLLILAVAGGYYALSTYRLDLGQGGKTEVIHRGDLTLPINATGEVRPAHRVEIKAEASGEVIEIRKRAGERVQAGDLIMHLKKTEEQRSVDRAQREVDRYAALLEAAKVTRRQRQTTDLAAAEAEVKVIESMLPYYEFRAKALDLPDSDKNFANEELVQRKVTYENQKAQLASAQARRDAVKLAIELAEQDVAQMEATYQAALSTLGDAKERLEKTDIIAPCDGMVGNVYVQEGEVIQGGKTTFTGGTLLAVVLDVDRILVQAEVDEAEIGAVRKIAPAWARPNNDGSVTMPADLEAAAAQIEHLPRIEVEAFRGEEFTGVIERIYPEPRTISGVTTYLVDVVLLGENRLKLFPGMRAAVEFTAEKVENVVLCPNEALREGPDGRLGVYVPVKDRDSQGQQEDKKFVPCKIGLDNGVYSEIREGLAEGDTVYTKLPVNLEKERERRKK
ncbi:MAG TPA: HlyD family efflux transporter periplasmic adaptor subunit [Phycisphaerae bacterium]|nr:HlyD family efflux transporter periplasmic adaptor subunit [Phycisphaerae bacterium]HNU44079.1 HlyD family efflux transporter periplasmic adaptor subunit [Phycisphaerae bacterium]